MNKSISGMIIFDAMNVYQACVGPEYIEYDTNQWFAALVHELVDNSVKEYGRRSSNTGRPSKVEATPKLLPSNYRRKVITDNWWNQGRCCICSFPQKSNDLCSVCSDKRGIAVFCCPQSSGRYFFETHFQECH